MDKPLILLARPERFELPTAWFVARYSIQLSYGRVVYFVRQIMPSLISSASRCTGILAEREGFEPSKGF